MSLDKFGNWVGEKFDDITGVTQAEASKEAAQTQTDAALQAAQLQQELGREAIASQEAAAAQQREDLQPFTQFGAGLIPQANQAFQQSQQLFGADAGQAIMNNPMFQAIQEQVQRDVLSNQAARGRVGTGETPQFLQDAALRTGFDILNQERNAALQNRASLMQALGLGQSSAAGQGAGSMQAAGNIGNILQTSGQLQSGFLTDAAAAQAAGDIGAANAQVQGTQNLISLGTTALGGLGGGGFGFMQPQLAPNQFSYNPNASGFGF